MFDKVKKLFQEESGITALETAIILIAFVVVASVFAFTILSAGTFSTERGKEAIYAGLEEVSSSMEVKGSVIAEASGSPSATNQIYFTLATVSGAAGVDMDPASDYPVVISYRDNDDFDNDITWTTTWLVEDGDKILEDGELVKVILDTGEVAGYAVAASETFALEVKPPKGAVISIQRTMPAALDTVMDLH